ncbi:MAG TPA: flagellar basal body-associated FliL family protein [Acidimicrobiia bacterium]|nr:flagellar basal body-associated FliL family protein [Acidimicrobiia bacterium]
MARKSKAADADGAAVEGEKKGKGNLVPALVIAAGLVGGGFLMGGRTAAPSAAAPAEGEAPRAAEEHEEEPVPGEVLTLDTMTLNLADGSFLKVGLALQLVEGVTPGGGGGHGGGGDADPKAYAAQALDEAIHVLGGHTFDDLLTPDGREKVKKELSERIGERYHGDVMAVYFTEFVMQ